MSKQSNPTRPVRRVRARPRHSLDRLSVGLAVLLMLIAGGAAYASFTAEGTGSGSATTGTMQTVSVSAFTGGDQPATTLVPGGTAGVMVRVTNPNSNSVEVHSVTANGPITADPGHSACTTAGVSFTAPAAPVSPTITIPADSSMLFHLPDAAGMDAGAQSACQGATFRIPITLTVRR